MSDEQNTWIQKSLERCEEAKKNAIEVRNESKEQIAKLWEEKTALQKEIEVTTLALSERNAENEFLESENERLRAIEKSRNKEVEKIVSEDYVGSDPAIKRMRALLAFLQLEHDYLSKQNKLLTDHYDTHLRSIEKLQAEKAELRKERDFIRQQDLDRFQSLQDADQKIRRLEAENAELKKQLGKAFDDGAIAATRTVPE